MSHARVGTSATSSVGTASRSTASGRSEIHQYVREINQFALLTPEEEKELGWAIVNDNCAEARDRMIRCNLRLVVAIGKRYANRGVSMADLIEEGNIGLMRAAEGFDPAQGARFSTYASWWIKQAMKRSLMTATQAVHIPAYMVELVAKWKAAFRRLETQLGKQPTMQDLAGELNLPLKKIRMIRRAVKAYQSPVTDSSSSSDVSRLSDIITDTRTAAPQDRMLRGEELSILKRLMDCISDREAIILRMRYGLDGSEVYTLLQISETLQISRERVRQIADEALTKLNARLTTGRWPDASEKERNQERELVKAGTV